MRMRIPDGRGRLWLALVLGGFALGACTPSPVYHHREATGGRPRVRIGSAARPSRGQRERKRLGASSLPDPRSLPRAVQRNTAHPIPVRDIDTSRAYQIGVASYYGSKFQGRTTASGAVFDMYRLTAAHRVLPLGTRIRVTNLSNGRWVDVEVNDRGPFVEGRILDVSYAAALELEMVAPGTARVMIEILESVD